jgi:hypothetical protein
MKNKICKCKKCNPKKSKKTKQASSTIAKKRLELIQIRGTKCEFCGRNIINNVYLHMHHINRNRSNNMDHNLLLLCATCHLNEHLDNQWVSKVLGAQAKKMEQEFFQDFC